MEFNILSIYKLSFTVKLFEKTSQNYEMKKKCFKMHEMGKWFLSLAYMFLTAF